MKSRVLAALAAGSVLAVPTAAQADVFNGRIAFSSFRTSPAGTIGDIFSDQPRRDRPAAADHQPGGRRAVRLGPDGRDIAYRIRKPKQTIELRGLADDRRGQGAHAADVTPDGQASSQPTWWPDRSRLLFRRSGPGVSSLWTMGRTARNQPCCSTRPAHQFYPAISPDASRSCSRRSSRRPATPTARSRRCRRRRRGEDAVRLPGRVRLRAPPGRRTAREIAFESNLDVFGVNPSATARSGSWTPTAQTR